MNTNKQIIYDALAALSLFFMVGLAVLLFGCALLEGQSLSKTGTEWFPQPGIPGYIELGIDPQGRIYGRTNQAEWLNYLDWNMFSTNLGQWVTNNWNKLTPAERSNYLNFYATFTRE